MTSAEAATKRPQRDMSADDEDWRLAAAARFSPEQQAAICALRVPHFVNTGRLRARRAALSAQLQVRARRMRLGTAMAGRPRFASRSAGPAGRQAGAPPPLIAFSSYMRGFAGSLQCLECSWYYGSIFRQHV